MAYTTIDDPSVHFQVAPTWTGGTSAKTLTNDGNSDLQPDLVWIKCRNASQPHSITDSSRGTSKSFTSATDAAEVDDSRFTSFNTDGFTLAGSSGPVNTSGGTYVGWQWKANGGTTASNSNGSITSTVQANTTAGFSIVQYTGTGTAATIGHGLGVAPDMYIVKNRDQTGTNWTIFHKDLTSNAYSLYLNSTAAQSNSVGYWNGTSPTSTVFSIKNTSGDVNTNTEDYVVYCFASKQGYSKFGHFTGNGVINGTFAYTGFKPAWVLIKEANSTTAWGYWDHKSVLYNPNNSVLLANTAAVPYTGSSYAVDFLSNGFKMRTNDGAWNGSDDTYIYAAFAEEPLVTSGGVPATAR